MLNQLAAARTGVDANAARQHGESVDELLTSRVRAVHEERVHGIPLDPFDVFGRTNDELTQSSVLRWLLDERGSHGLGRAFALEFFALVGWVLPAARYTTALEVAGRESVIDVVIDGTEFVLGIENKVWSAEGNEQTASEWRDLERAARGRRFGLVRLTPRGDLPGEKRAQPLGWAAIGDALRRSAQTAPASTRPWIEGICFHIERLFGNGGHDVRTEFREDVKHLIGRWRDYREVVDTFERAAEDLEAIQHAVAMALLQRPWAGAGWSHHAKGGVFMRRNGWGGGEDRIRLVVETIGLENIMGESKDLWWSGVQVIGRKLDQAPLSDALRKHAERIGVAADWTFQRESSDGAVMFRYLPPLTPAALVEGQLAATIEAEFDRLALFVETIDAFVGARLAVAQDDGT